ncbi:MAG: adenylosuccinate synthetase, partial [Candidatus Paceibacterota bacterium]
MAHKAVIGGLWGDEGKGKIVDYLTKDANIVARYQGGANAGHTIIAGDRKIVLHTIPSGICHKRKTNVIGNGVILNLDSLLQEMDMLKENGITVSPFNLAISGLCHITT